MKKSIFLILTILSLFIFSDNVNALSFTAPNGQEYNVDSAEKVLHFCYFKYYKNSSYNGFILGATNSSYYCIYTKYKPVFNSAIQDFNDLLEPQNFTYDNIGVDFTYKGGSSKKNTLTLATILYSNINIYSSTSFDSYSFNSNFNVVDIESKYIDIYTINYYVNDELYKTFEVLEGTSHELINYDYNKNTHNFSGWNIETENVDLKNITSNITIKATLEEKDVLPVYIEFPINKTEFYALLVEVGVLIMIIFLKWCFPFKGGSDL